MFFLVQAHCKAFIVGTFASEIREMMISEKLQQVITQLCELYTVFNLLRDLGSFLVVSSWSNIKFSCLCHSLFLFVVFRPLIHSFICFSLASIFLFFHSLPSLITKFLRLFLFQYSNLQISNVEELRERQNELLAEIRPNAVGLVDSFDIHDNILGSALGAYDGRVYERLFEQANQSPLNKEPVNISFHKYLKPFLKSNMWSKNVLQCDSFFRSFLYCWLV